MCPSTTKPQRSATARTALVRVVALKPDAMGAELLEQERKDLPHRFADVSLPLVSASAKKPTSNSGRAG